MAPISMDHNHQTYKWSFNEDGWPEQCITFLLHTNKILKTWLAMSYASVDYEIHDT